MLFKLFLIIAFIVIQTFCIYYVSHQERTEEINRKRRENRIRMITYQNQLDFENYLKQRYPNKY